MLGGIGGIMVTGNATATRSAGVVASRRRGGGYGGSEDGEKKPKKDKEPWGCLVAVGIVFLIITMFILFLDAHSPS